MMHGLANFKFKCHINMLSQDVCLYPDASLLRLRGSVRQYACSYLFGCACV